MKNIIERIKTKPGYKFLAVMIILIAPLYLLHLTNESELNNIKNNPDIDVVCNIKGQGYISIDKDKIVSMNGTTIVFTNGSASNCEINNLNKGY